MNPVNNSTERRPLDKPTAKEPAAPEKAARFRALLDKPNKNEQKKPRPTNLGKKKDDDAADPATMQPKMTPQPELRPIAVEKVEAPRPVIEPKIVEGLVREITVITEADRTDVRIQLNSKTLDGLQIKISKENGNVSLQFFTTSPEVERVLQRNMDQLTQALIQRGITVGSNKIERVATPATAEQTSGRQSGGKRQQGRQR